MGEIDLRGSCLCGSVRYEISGSEARIFQDSKAAWSCDDREVPGYDTYPG